KDGRTYVPVRYLAYVCGLTDKDIAWDGATQTVTLTKGSKVVKLVIGSKTLTAGDQTTEMDVAPEISNGRTMLPARYVAEAFGGTVTWNEATKAVSIQF
ncbi:MAG: copper amine oxidase N-terminal domain-containing protein, partial [Peptococcaceae bacterium]|nr:copper amine oxidase N-terminal domain-containing protein [Peptococcaceae bacterium]